MIEEIKKYTQHNRQAWNEIAQVREKQFPQAEFFQAGKVTSLVDFLRDKLDVKGKRLIHLQCATGEDTLSWAVLGAEATGVDISDQQIELARQKAEQAGLNAHFVAADVYDLPAEVIQPVFDIVFTGGGALVWLPEIWEWGKIVCRLLKPGGRLVLYEEHPIAGSLWAKEGRLVINWDYFGRKRTEPETGWAHFKGGEDAKEVKYEFAWPLGDVVTALAKAGLRIESLEEFPGGAQWRFGDHPDARSLPGSYLLIASK